MLPREDALPPSRVLDPRMEFPRKSMGSINVLKDLCMQEGLSVAFQTQPQFSGNSGLKNEILAQVEINGQIMGKGIGLTWDEAKSQAAENALGALRPMLGQVPYRRQDSPRSMHGMPNKRLKPDYSRNLQRMPSYNRYPKNTSPVP